MLRNRKCSKLLFFIKNADQLTLSEAALLVGLSNNPSRYDPVTNYNSSIRKRDRVLKHMLDAKVISKTQYQQAKNEKNRNSRVS